MSFRPQGHGGGFLLLPICFNCVYCPKSSRISPLHLYNVLVSHFLFPGKTDTPHGTKYFVFIHQSYCLQIRYRVFTSFFILFFLALGWEAAFCLLRLSWASREREAAFGSVKMAAELNFWRGSRRSLFLSSSIINQIAFFPLYLMMAPVPVLCISCTWYHIPYYEV